MEGLEEGAHGREDLHHMDELPHEVRQVHHRPGPEVEHGLAGQLDIRQLHQRQAHRPTPEVDLETDPLGREAQDGPVPRQGSAHRAQEYQDDGGLDPEVLQGGARGGR